MSETCAVCKQGKGPEVCEVCGFTDGGAINREWLNKEDAELWLETVVKPYRVRWEAKKREAELLAQIEGLEAKLSTQPTPAISPTVLMDSIVGIEMVFVQGGTFKMGDTDGRGADNKKPVHDVTLGDFYIGKYPVTQKLWFLVTGVNPSYFKGDNLPVETVSCDDVQIFISTLNLMTGKEYRLPTDAEWEYAARGGINSRGYEYPGSDNIDDVAWYMTNSGKKTHSVGTKAPNELGIYDMCGNVGEWVSDWYEEFCYGSSPVPNPTTSPVINPTGPSTGYNRMFRGGSWLHNAKDSRVFSRNASFPENKVVILGFRLALSP